MKSIHITTEKEESLIGAGADGDGYSADSEDEEISSLGYPVSNRVSDIPSLVDNLYVQAIERIDSSKTKVTVSRELAILVIAAFGALNYKIPAGQAATDEHSLMVSDIALLSQLGTCFPSAAILYNATAIFFDWVNKERLPKTLSMYFPRKNWRVQLLKDFGLVIGSAICSIPLAGTYIAYTTDPLYLVIMLGLIIEVANTLMHFLPLKLMLKEPIYRFPVLPIEWLVRKAIRSCQSDRSRLSPADEKALSETLEKRLELSTRIQEYTTVQIDESLLFKLSASDIQLTSIIRTSQQSQTLRSLFTEQPSESGSDNRLALHHRFLRSRIKEIVFWLGGLWLITCAIPFSYNTYNLVQDKIGNEMEAWLVAALPAYAFAVLVVFLGGQMMVDAVNTVLKAIEGKNILPTSGRLFPAAFLLLQLVTLYCGLFSYSATVTLLRDNFTRESVGSFYDVLMIGGVSSEIYLSMDAVVTFLSQWLEKYANRQGSQQQKDLIAFMRATDLVAAWVNHLDPKKMQELINQTNDTDNQVYFGATASDSSLIEEIESPPVTTASHTTSSNNGDGGSCWKALSKHFGIFNSQTEEQQETLLGNNRDGSEQELNTAKIQRKP